MALHGLVLGECSRKHTTGVGVLQQRPGIEDQGLGVKIQGFRFRVRVWGSGAKDQRPRLGSETRSHESVAEGQGPWIRDQWFNSSDGRKGAEDKGQG